MEAPGPTQRVASLRASRAVLNLVVVQERLGDGSLIDLPASPLAKAQAVQLLGLGGHDGKNRIWKVTDGVYAIQNPRRQAALPDVAPDIADKLTAHFAKLPQDWTTRDIQELEHAILGFGFRAIYQQSKYGEPLWRSVDNTFNSTRSPSGIILAIRHLEGEVIVSAPKELAFERPMDRVVTESKARAAIPKPAIGTVAAQVTQASIERRAMELADELRRFPGKVAALQCGGYVFRIEQALDAEDYQEIASQISDLVTAQAIVETLTEQAVRDEPITLHALLWRLLKARVDPDSRTFGAAREAFSRQYKLAEPRLLAQFKRGSRHRKMDFVPHTDNKSVLFHFKTGAA